MRKLKLILATLALILGWSNAWAQETPINGSAYYIYNETNDLFFTRGAAYGTQAYASPFGIPWRVEISGSGDYTLKMNDIYLQNSVDQGLGYNGSYTDNGSPIALTPSGNASDGYTLKNGDNYITCPSSKGVVSMTTTASTWKFLTQAQYDAVLAARASTQETAVATSKGISIPGGSTLAEVVSDASAWTSTTTNDATPTKSTWPLTTRGSEKRDNTYNEGDYGIELFQANDAYISKTISGLAQGIYKVTVRGMKRMGTNEGSVALKSAGFYVSDAYMEANGNIIPMKSWASDNTADAVPNGPAAVATIIGNGGYTNEGFVYVGNDGNLSLSIHTDAFWWGCWLVFNGISYTYYNNEVTNEEAEALLATVPTAPMLKATKDALDLAQSNFKSSQTISNYNALSTAIDNANASISVYAPLGTKLTEAATVKSSVSSNSPSYVTTFDSNIGTINTNYTGGLIAESDITTQIAAVETEILKLVKSQTVSGSDMTRALPNAACTGAAGDDNWKIKNELVDGEYFRLDTWAGDASGMSVPMIEYWITNGNTLSSNEIYQTITGLENGVYTVTATTAVNNESKEAPKEGSALLFANDATKDITSGGTETKFKGQTGTFSVNVVLTDADGGELKLGLKTDTPNYNWIAFKNFTLTYYGPVAEDADYTALQDAINAAEAKTLGFENGEYAPYSNVDALKALADAKAIDKEAPNTKTVVNNATSALTGATWTANVGEVNAFCGGDFTQYETIDGKDYPYGWNLYNGASNHSRIMGGTEGTSNEGLSASSSGKALLLKFNATYGETDGYTMPLKAGKIYKITFKHGRWAEEHPRKTNVVVTDPNGNAITLAPGFQAAADGCQSDKTKWYEYTGYFVSTTAGDYKFNFEKALDGSGKNSQMQIGIADIDLHTAEDITFADESVPTYAPGTYPSVKITRTLTANRWATAVYPFAVSGVDNIAVLNSFDAGTGSIRFESVSESVANEPFLMRSSTAKSVITLNDIAVSATTETPTVTKDEASLIGAYSSTAITNAADNYVLSNNMIYAVGDAGATINPYRAYIQIAGGSGARSLVFFVDEETTAIEGLNSERATTVGNIYNLNGQLVRKNADNLNGLRKGIYIVGGKRITVK